MINIHPPLTGFPVVLLTLVVGAESLVVINSIRGKKENLKLRAFADCILALAVLFSPITYYSGYFGAEHANQSFVVKEEVISNHQTMAQVFLLLLLLSAGLRLVERAATFGVPYLRVSYRLALCACFLMVSYVSFLGGDLVFNHGAGVSALSENMNSGR